MSAASVIPAALLAAYQATDFRIELPDRIIHLSVGLYNQELEALHFQHHVTSSAFISAYNPRSEPTSPEANNEAQLALIAQLQSLHLPLIHGAGVGADTAWPPEPSILVLGISLEDAYELARQHQQNAFVFNDASAVATLCLCR